MDKDFQDQLAKTMAENTKKELVRIRKIYAAGLDPHSTADYKTVADAIEKELQK